MRKLKRRKIVREALEARLLKNERRMQAISEESYQLRLALERLDATPKQVPLTKKAREEAEKQRAAEPGTLPPVLPVEEPIEQKETPNAVS